MLHLNFYDWVRGRVASLTQMTSQEIQETLEWKHNRDLHKTLIKSYDQYVSDIINAKSQRGSI